MKNDNTILILFGVGALVAFLYFKNKKTNDFPSDIGTNTLTSQQIILANLALVNDRNLEQQRYYQQYKKSNVVSGIAGFIKLPDSVDGYKKFVENGIKDGSLITSNLIPTKTLRF
jgi:hypothetical protein